jgi:hypothetical protein
VLLFLLTGVEVVSILFLTACSDLARILNRPWQFQETPLGQNNYRTLGASVVRRVAGSPLPFFMKNRLIVFERAAAANTRLSNRARQ